ncbi:J domain-containing protein [Treponema primitia]|uniref:J domain-containing protein n=1 Tax=Treponema primitia TaxID=88058 RepID=UPI0005A1BDDF|nr:J domain-containing protein [Treponema primitia]
MGILDRLGDVIKSYLNDTGNPAGERIGRRYADPDLDEAYEELNEFLAGGKPGNREDSQKRDNQGAFNSRGSEQTAGRSLPPENLRADFAELGLPFGAPEEECKTAYKQLLKIHHPDRHAGHEGNMKKATEKSARINAAYDRIEKWRATGKAE